MKDIWNLFGFNQKVGLILTGIGLILGVIALNKPQFAIGTWVIGLGIGWFACSIRNKN